MPRFCTQCGQANADDAGFCESCGQPMGVLRPTPPAAKAPALQRGPARLGVVIGVLAALIVIGAGLAAEFIIDSRPVTSLLASWGLDLRGTGSKGDPLYLVGRNGQWGYVDRRGTEVIGFQYEEPPTDDWDTGSKTYRSFVIRNLAPYPVYQAGGWALLDRRGTPISKVRFEDLVDNPSDAPFVCGQHKQKTVCVDALGAEVAGFRHDWIGNYGDGLWGFGEAGQGKLVGLLNQKGEVVVAPAFQSIKAFQPGVPVSMAVFPDKKYGLIDRRGKEVGKSRYDFASTPSADIWPVMQNERWGLANLQGEVTQWLDPGINFVKTFSEGVAPACTQTGDGLIEKSGRWVVAPQRFLHSVQPFADGRARAGHFAMGFIGKDGKYVVPPIFDEVAGFVGGAAIAQFGSQAWLIDTAGRILWPKDKKADGAPTSNMAGVIGSSWQLVRAFGGGFRSAMGSRWEYSETKARMNMNGRQREFEVKFTEGSPGRMTLNRTTARYWVYADHLVTLADDNEGSVLVFQRIADAASEPARDAVAAKPDTSAGSILSKLLPRVGGSSVVGRWGSESMEFEFYEDNTLVFKEGKKTVFTGKWNQLSDGRIKIDAQFIGMALPPIIGVMQADTLELTGEIVGQVRLARVK